MFQCRKTIARIAKLTQDWENIEIIIVNDGSTDNSRKILENFLQLSELIIRRMSCSFT